MSTPNTPSPGPGPSLALADRKPPSFGVRTAATAAVLAGLSGVLALIVSSALIPGRSRVGANESATVGDLRTLVSAEILYSSENGGFFDRPECLQAPSGCIPKYAGPVFSDIAMSLLGTRLGYERTFHAGPAASLDRAARERLSPSSLTTFAVVAVPLKVGTTGFRAFCADSNAMVFYSVDGATPRVRAGACVPEGLRPL